MILLRSDRSIGKFTVGRVSPLTQQRSPLSTLLKIAIVSNSFLVSFIIPSYFAPRTPNPPVSRPDPLNYSDTLRSLLCPLARYLLPYPYQQKHQPHHRKCRNDSHKHTQEIQRTNIAPEGSRSDLPSLL